MLILQHREDQTPLKDSRVMGKLDQTNANMALDNAVTQSSAKQRFLSRLISLRKTSKKRQELEPQSKEELESQINELETSSKQQLRLQEAQKLESQGKQELEPQSRPLPPVATVDSRARRTANEYHGFGPGVGIPPLDNLKVTDSDGDLLDDSDADDISIRDDRLASRGDQATDDSVVKELMEKWTTVNITDSEAKDEAAAEPEYLESF